MEAAKSFFVRHFEVATVFVLVVATAIAVLVVVNKLAFLNVFHIPVLVAAYFLGKRQGMLAAFAAVLMVGLYVTLNPSTFTATAYEQPQLDVALWGAFTILTAYVVGNLYELKESSQRDLRQAYEGILEILAKFIDAVDRYTKDHSARVAELAVQTAGRMGLSAAEIDDIRVAGMLHDVGKVDVSLDVLRKASKLTDSEWTEVRSHVHKGSDILRPVGGLLRDVIPIVEAHHEAYDGSGYLGLEADRIPLGARILAVADAYDAMVCDRPYRSARTPSDAVRELERCKGTQFDPSVVDAFKTVVQANVEYA